MILLLFTFSKLWLNLSNVRNEYNAITNIKEIREDIAYNGP